MLTRGLCLLAVLLIAIEAAAQNPSVDVLHYRVAIALGEEIIEATTELTVRPVTATLDALQLDFAGLTIDAERFGIAAARGDGQAIVRAREARGLPFHRHRVDGQSREVEL